MMQAQVVRIATLTVVLAVVPVSAALVAAALVAGLALVVAALVLEMAVVAVRTQPVAAPAAVPEMETVMETGPAQMLALATARKTSTATVSTMTRDKAEVIMLPVSRNR